MTDKKPRLYRREDSPNWWAVWYDSKGDRQWGSTGTQDEEKAKKVLRDLARTITAQIESGFIEHGPVTVRRYAEEWIKKRREMGIGAADDDDAKLRMHILPRLGSMRLEEVRRADVLAMVGALQKSRVSNQGRGKEHELLSPRTVLHIYGVLRVMYADAMADGLIESTPCTLRERRKELPKKKDKDPRWRKSAIYSREEVEALISDLRIPLWRRTYWGLLFLGGMRVGEASARRWADLDTKVAPLQQLSVLTSYNIKRKLEKETKTDDPREVPVHPVLAKMLDVWRHQGWPQIIGRTPEPGDHIVPGRGRGKGPTWKGPWSATSSLKRLHEDCALLGLRPRRQHDARRTLVSLLRTDGANPDIVRIISHGTSGSGVLDLYTTISWQGICAEMLRLAIRPPEGGAVLRLAEHK